MNRTNPPSARKNPGAYVLDFYQTALYPPAARRSYWWPAAQAYVLTAGKEEPVKRPRTKRLEGLQTVEQIVAEGYFAAPPGDPVTALIADREHTSKLGLDDVITQIRQRYVVWQRNVDDIETAKLAAINALHDWEAEWGRADPQQLSALHTTLQRLYQQERDERGSLWRDVSRLKQALPESAQQYLSAYRKVSLLKSEPGDAL